MGSALYLFEKKVFFFYETPYWPAFAILAMFSESGRKGGTPLGWVAIFENQQQWKLF